MTSAAPPQVRAAGGILRVDGRILLVHRPRYDDWTFPKGKAYDGEPDEACALREVLEETGFVCRLGPELLSTAYTDARGRSKVVRYWLMDILDGDFEPTDEVDEILWAEPSAASALLSYERDRGLLASLPPVAA